MTEPSLPYAYLAGGRIKLHETSEQALQRELLEELHESPTRMQFLWTVENFFIDRQKQFHEICLFYLVELDPNSPLLELDTFEKMDHHKIHLFSWVDIHQLSSVNLLPHFLVDKLSLLDTPLINPNHFMHIDAQSSLS
jgi:8-oxo-dGTP pyrophosphatase MutT (NUDIX family)